MKNRILWMHDLSAGADACEGPILTVARWMDGEVSVVHATGAPMEDPERGGDPALEARRALALEHLDPVVRRVHAAGLAADLIVAPGQPLEVAEELVRDAVGALVVVGASGVHGIDRLLLGSTAGRLLRHLPCPVLVVRGALHRGARVMCAVDPEEPSDVAILQAAALARRAGATLDYVAIVSPVLGIADTEPASDRVREHVERLTGDALRAPWSARSVVAETPAQGILHIASAYDLLVLGSRSRTGLKRLLLGSVAENVVSKSPVCVLVAR